MAKSMQNEEKSVIEELGLMKPKHGRPNKSALEETQKDIGPLNNGKPSDKTSVECSVTQGDHTLLELVVELGRAGSDRKHLNWADQIELWGHLAKNCRKPLRLQNVWVEKPKDKPAALQTQILQGVSDSQENNWLQPKCP
ncbi:hypothetical protein Ancab_007766, partial [Ancistrocladus abbreviatus]